MKSRRLFAATLSALALAWGLAAATTLAQSTTTFATPLNNVWTAVGVGGHAVGSGTLKVATGKGSLFGTPSASAPVRVTVVRSGDSAIAIYKATGISGDTLTGLAAVEGTADLAFSAGDSVQMRVTAGTISDLNTAVNAAETKINALQAGGGGGGVTFPNGVLKGSGGLPVQATPGTDFLTPTGSGAGLTGITEGQVANLTTDLAAHSTAIAGKLAAASNLSDVASAATARTNLGLGTAATRPATDFALGLAPTAVKTSAYTLAAGDFAPADTTAGAFTMTLPAAPADRTIVGAKIVAGGNALTIAAGGSDVFTAAGGSTTLTLSLLRQGVVLQYKAAGGIWYATAADLPLSQLDARYPADSAVVHLAGAETIAGAKTFSTAPTVGTLAGMIKGTAGALGIATPGTDYAQGVTGTNPIGGANLAAAYTASSFRTLADGATVTTWADEGPNGYHLAAGQGAPVYQATAAESGRPGVRFDGASNLVNASLSGNLGAWTVILVITPETRGVTSVPVGFNTATQMGVVFTNAYATFNTASGNAGGAVFDGKYALASPGAQVVTAVSDGTNWRLGTNGQEYTLSPTPVASSSSVTGVTMGSYPNSSFYMKGIYHALYVFNRAVPSTELLTYTRYLHALHNVQLHADSRRPVILWDGNSIMQGVRSTAAANEPPEVAMDLLGRDNFWSRNVAFSGATNTQVSARLAATTGPIVAGSQRLKIVVPWEASNETTQASIAAMYTGWVAQPGTSVFALTSVARSSALITTTNNAYIRANWKSWGCVGLIDVAQDYRLGQQASNTNTAYFNSDNTHPNDAGNRIIGTHFYNHMLPFLYPNGGGPDPNLPGLTLDATPVAVKSWFPTLDGVYVLRVNAVANRVDSGTEDAILADGLYKIRVASGVATVTQVAAPAATYNTLTTATLGVSQSALGTGGFDVKVTGEASKVLAWKVTLKLSATN